MKYLLFPAMAIAAYLLCGLNPAILLSKAVYKQDIRDYGSHNPGFTNFKRVYGKLAWLVFALDIGKTVLAVGVGKALFGQLLGIPQLGAAFTGCFAMLGHLYPVWYRFKGGKGFLVTATSVWFLDWRAGLAATVVFLLLLAVFRYISLSSICFSVTCPVALAICGTESVYVLLITVFCTVLLILRHRTNIQRLISGTESRFSLFKIKTNKNKRQEYWNEGIPAVCFIALWRKM